VKNTSDGKVGHHYCLDILHVAETIQVEGEAQGDKSSLDKLTKDLNRGPPAAHVVKLETSEISTRDGETEFRS
jgi:acylphosphatase